MEEKKLYIAISTACVLLAVFLIFKKNHVEQTIQFEKQVTIDKVDKYRKQVIHNRKLEQSKIRAENYSNRVNSEGHNLQHGAANYETSLKLESSVNHAAQDAGRKRGAALPNFSPESQINQLLVAKQKYEEMTVLQKQQYVANFKKEAKKLGFDVKLDDQLEVIHFKRIPASQRSKDQSDEFFQGEDFY